MKRLLMALMIVLLFVLVQVFVAVVPAQATDLVPETYITTQDGTTGFFKFTASDESPGFTDFTTHLNLNAIGNPNYTEFTVTVSPDTNGDGKPEVTVTYVPPDPPVTPTFDRFDVNQDGTVDVMDFLSMFNHFLSLAG